MTTRRMQGAGSSGVVVRRLAKALAAGTTVTLVLTSCGVLSDDEEGSGEDVTVTCVDANDVVVDPALCDDTDDHPGSYFFWVDSGSHSYSNGQQLTPSGSSQRAYFRDPAAREAVNLTKSGSQTLGVIRGGLGSSSSGSSGS